MKDYKELYKANVLLLILFFICLLAYIVIRANVLSFTHDECLSYTILEGNRVWILNPNNHPLNTILMFVSKLVFGNSELALRLPNVLASLLYFTACVYIFRQSKNAWLFLLGTSLAILNPFLIEFFSLARGYGLSLSFMLMSLYFLVRKGNHTVYSELRKEFILSAIFASLAAGSNLIMINFLISILVIFTYKFWFLGKNNRGNSKNMKDFILVFLVFCIPIILGIAFLLILDNMGQLYYGAMSFDKSLESVITQSIYFAQYPHWVVYTSKLIIIISVLVGAVLIGVKKKFNGSLFILTLLILTIATGFALEHFLFNSKLPIGRTALFYIPLFAVYIYYLFSELIATYNIPKLVYIPIILCLITPVFFNFYEGSNTKYTKIWRYDAHTKSVMNVIKNITENADQNLSISNYKHFEPSINHYITVWDIKVNPTTRDGMNLNSDFIYDAGSKPTPKGYEVLTEYHDPKATLFIKSEMNKK